MLMDSQFSTSRRAAMAVLMRLPYWKGQAKEAMRLGGKRSGATRRHEAFPLGRAHSKPTSLRATELAGKEYGVSGRSVQQAAVLYDQEPDLFEAVLAGRLTLRRATKELRRRGSAAQPRSLSPRRLAAQAVTGCYVYGWYEPGESLPCYIGEGQGTRAWDVHDTEGLGHPTSYTIWVYRDGLTKEGSLLVESVLIDLFLTMGAPLRNKRLVFSTVAATGLLGAYS